MPVGLDKNISHDVQDIYPLTPLQEGILFHYLRDPENIAYCGQLCLRLAGELDRQRFQQAWSQVVSGCDALRSVFRWDKVGQPLQLVLKNVKSNLHFFEFSHSSELEERLLKERNDRFDLQEETIRVALCSLESGVYQLILTFHHIILDGWSTGIVLDRLFEMYEHLSRGGSPPVFHKKQSFKEFVKYCRTFDRQAEENFWETYLKDFESAASLPISMSASLAGEKKTGDRHRTTIDSAMTEQLSGIAKNGKTTIATLLYCCWGIVLHYYAGNNDVVFGTTVSGRNVPVMGVEEIVGLCINTIPCRIVSGGAANLEQMLRECSSSLREREQFENTPLVRIGEYISRGQSARLFDHLLVIENYPINRKLLEKDYSLKPVSFEMRETTHYDLTIGIDIRETIELEFEFNPPVLSRPVIQRMAGHFTNVLSQFIYEPGKRLSEVEVMSPAEKRQMIGDFDKLSMGMIDEASIASIVAEQAAKTPDAAAVCFHDRIMTYGFFVDMSLSFTALLKKNGLEERTIAAVMMERSDKMVVALFAALEAGAAVMPLDPEAPLQRLRYMLADANVGLLAAEGESLEKARVLSFPGAIVAVDLPPGISSESKRIDGASPPADAPAFVFYTSGTTGVPKGILVEHQNAVNVVRWYGRTFGLGPGKMVFCLSEYTFDPSMEDMFGALSTGAVLVQAERILLLDAARFVRFVEKHDIYLLNGVPSLLRELLSGDRRLPGLKVVISGGEGIDESLKERLLSLGYSLYNNYGPTEITVDACSARLTAEPVTLGFPIDNVCCYVVNRSMRLLPAGIQGELCVGGRGVTRGYLNDPEATCRAFTPATWDAGLRLYRTGDRVVSMEDGQIRFLGRLDRQLKIRGYRVDPSEIEHVMLEYPGIQDAAVAHRGDGDGIDGLHAYLVGDGPVSLGGVKDFLRKKLPAYMVPGTLSQLEKIPLTATGKVDWKELTTAATGVGDATPASGSETELQKKVADVWRDILQKRYIGSHENFFDAGGNSLLVIRLVSRLKTAFGVDIPVTSIFQHSTITSFSGYLEGLLAPVEQTRQRRHSNRIANKTSSRPKVDIRPIAVIGMAGRFPKAENITEFWRNLEAGVEAVTHFSERQLREMGIDDAIYLKANHVPSKGVLPGYEYFDATFFGYSAREAEMMDPQLRVLCETAWEVLEDAGCDPSSYDGDIGFYAGTLSNYHWMRELYRSVRDHADYMALESVNDRDFVCSRISYALDLRGPAVNIQTACSTSLVAVASACNALTADQCRMAIAGGVSITLEDEGGYLYQEGMVRSADGRCRAFDKRAGGTVGGNGVGLAALKPLDLAKEEGDHIYAIIKGWAVNNDGARKVGFTAPGVSGQMEVIRSALDRAGVPPHSIGFVETHGTGTPLGDPVEIEALRQVFGQDSGGKIVLGAVKTNIGHLDAAAGIAGLIKTVLALQRRLIPPTLHFETANPGLELERSPFSVATMPMDWERGQFPRRAGVSSFGIGGTNAHLVLEEWDPLPKQVDCPANYHLILLSAVTDTALVRRMDRLKQYLVENPSLAVEDIAYTLQAGRKGFSRRMWCVAQNTGDVVDMLSRPHGGGIRSAAAPENSPRVFFMFPGQGAQYVNMGLELYRSEPVFREILDEGFAVLRRVTGMDLKRRLYPCEGELSLCERDLHCTAVTQPLLVAFEYALARCLMAWGIQPNAMIGHSVGEYTAALLSGVFGFEEALTLAAERGRIIQKLEEGSMLAAPLGEEEALRLIWGKEGLALAAVNGPAAVVISGPSAEVEALAARLRRKGVIPSKLFTSHAFHSPMMVPAMEPLRKCFGSISLHAPKIPFVANVSGEWAGEQTVMDPDYWVSHLRSTVRFSDGLGRLMDMGDAIFIEMGPGNSLSTLGRKQDLRREGHSFVNIMRHPKEMVNDERFLLEKIGEIWAAGVAINWEAFNGGRGNRRVPLPAYPFERQYYWTFGSDVRRLQVFPVEKRIPWRGARSLVDING